MRDPRYAPLVLDHIRRGNFTARWMPASASGKGKSGRTHTATIYVLADALMIEGVRVAVSAITAQQIGDMLGASLHTGRTADLAWWSRSATIAPVVLSQTAADLNNLTTSAYLLRHSDGVQAQIDALTPAQRAGIVRDVGKFWIRTLLLVQRPSKGINYGYFSERGPHQCVDVTGPPCRVIQQPGDAHPANHIDASQMGDWLLNVVTVDGIPRDLDDVEQDPELWPLFSVEGPMTVHRQPNVPAPKGPSVILPAIVASPATSCPDPGLGRVAGAVPYLGGRAGALLAWSRAIEDAYPLGTVARDTVDGLPFIGRVECEREGASWRKATRLYVPARYDAQGTLTARTSPPPGWPGS